jgi:hypothetical protein
MAQVGHLNILLDTALKKSGVGRSGKGFEKLAEDIGNGIKESYLQKKIYHEIKDAPKDHNVPLREEYLDIIAGYIGFVSYRTFVESLSAPPNPVLATCVGNYYSFIRMNNRKTTVILRSPARIFKGTNGFEIELKGKENIFRGEITLRDSCLFATLHSPIGKTIHHIYKVGANKSPKVLQGIFCAVTSMFDPIGGRVVLMRTNQDFEEMSIGEITEATSTKNKDIKTLFEYLKNFSENNLSISPATSCTIRDLVG